MSKRQNKTNERVYENYAEETQAPQTITNENGKSYVNKCGVLISIYYWDWWRSSEVER